MFYVYVLRYPDGIPFYVGKGSGKRAHRHSTECPNVKIILDDLRVDGKTPIIDIVFRTADESEAYQKEKFFIGLLGRKDERKGPLLNKADGGFGSKVGRIVSEKTRQNLSNIGFKIRSSKEYRDQQADGTKRQWQDENRRGAYKKFQKDRWRTDEIYRRRVSEAARLQAITQWNDPAKRARLLEARKNARKLK